MRKNQGLGGFAVAAALSALIWLAAGCGGTKCGPGNCAGCCDSNGLCEEGNVTNACGANGLSCQTCTLSQTCELGQCATISQQCSPSNCNGCCNGSQCVQTCPNGTFCGPSGTCLQSGDGGSCGPTNCSGCCLGSTCVPPASETTSLCGSSASAGSTCISCGTGQSCSGGACTGGTGCSASNCDGCCEGNTCVLVANETTSDCGASAAHGAACVACGTGQSCSGGACTGGTGCNASNCAGCCVGNTTCVLVADETTSDCGSTAAHGAACVACGAAQTCSGGVCTGGTSCGPSNCAGCCVGTTCITVANETSLDCGSGIGPGLACTTCGGGQSCSGGVCVSTTTCNSGNCSGCCSSNTCIALTSESASQCGTGGAVCAACTIGDACTQGVCQSISVTVSTLAGNGAAGFIDALGTAAEFDGPGGVAVDSFGFVYVPDESNERVRMVDTSGNVSTLAGNGDAGFADGLNAMFDTPSRLAVDSNFVYISDSTNNRIRTIALDGTVATLAGNGVAGFFDGAAASAEFNLPYGVAVNAQGVVYVADQGNNRIRKISGGMVSTVAGSGVAGSANGQGTAAQFNGPGGIAVDNAGNLYVSDTTNERIRKIDPQGNVTTLAGSGVAGFLDGAGSTAEFSEPRGIAVDSSGIVYVADQVNNRIRRIDAQGNVSTFAGTGVAGFADGSGTTAQFNGPAGVAVDSSGTVYVGDTTGQRVRVIK
jgi:hypothetical protein